MVYINLNNRTMPQNMSIGKTPQTTFVKVDAELSKVNHYGIDFNLSAIEVCTSISSYYIKFISLKFIIYSNITGVDL